MTVIIHIAGGKGLGNGKVSIQQLLLQFADSIIDIILMRGYAGMLLKQLGEMGFAKACCPCRFVGIKRLLPMSFYVLSAPFNFFFPPVYFFKDKNGGKAFYHTISVYQ